ncbi:hypothetical protein NDU88_002392 [Pleurodeles waltl]|uniref:Uncharacterized protein n=1 Tax=Pleurodeles waltl TaxID=8319 RepID=A0AAV7SCC7_PLEWA|nr:hypothetical protein NDU88_002392 [Pleurodeles waltl]
MKMRAERALSAFNKRFQPFNTRFCLRVIRKASCIPLPLTKCLSSSTSSVSAAYCVTPKGHGFQSPPLGLV